MTSIDELEKIFMEIPDLADLSADDDTRFSQLEEQIRKVKPLVNEKKHSTNAQMQAVREKEKAIIMSYGIEHEYMDEPFLVPKYDLFSIHNVPSGRVVLYGLDDENIGNISRGLRIDLQKDHDALQPHLADSIRWMQILHSFQEDLAVRYAKIYAITELPEFPIAFCITLGYAPEAGSYYADMRNGNIRSAGIDEGVTRTQLFGMLSLIKESHEGHEYNTYIITHPSELLTSNLLGMHSYEILLPRWQALHPENLH